MRYVLLLIFCCILTSCRTNSALDAFLYPSEFIYLQNDENREAVCIALEEMGYQFDMFSLSQQAVEVQYPNGEMRTYIISTSVGGRVLTSINRDYDSPYPISEAELDRLRPEAEQLCLDMKYEANRMLNVNSGISFVLYDWINGVTINYYSEYFSDNCEAMEVQSIAIGGYGDFYTYENLASICVKADQE